jgi:hypothetical protein
MDEEFDVPKLLPVTVRIPPAAPPLGDIPDMIGLGTYVNELIPLEIGETALMIVPADLATWTM